MSATARKATNLSLDCALLAEARSLKVNLSRAAEDGVVRAVAQARAEQWKEDNADALASSNDWVSRHGLPLDRYRNF